MRPIHSIMANVLGLSVSTTAAVICDTSVTAGDWSNLSLSNSGARKARVISPQSTRQNAGAYVGLMSPFCVLQHLQRNPQRQTQRRPRCVHLKCTPPTWFTCPAAAKYLVLHVASGSVLCLSYNKYPILQQRHAWCQRLTFLFAGRLSCLFMCPRPALPAPA